MSLWVKYCGIRRVEDAVFAVDLGVDAIGIVVVPSSPRCATREDLSRLARVKRGHSKFVLVAQDQARDEVVEFVELCLPDMIQFHGIERREFCESFELPYIKATKNLKNLARLGDYTSAFAHLVDSENFDGTGAERLNRMIIAGGLTCENIAERITMTRPWGIDVSRGIEQSPGVKDQKLMRDFLSIARGAIV